MSGSSAEEIRVSLEEVSLQLGDRKVFEGCSCEFPRGRISIVLGGSGAGKSTLLRLIGGLQRPDRGLVIVAGRDVTRLSETELFEARERIGMLFQYGALLDSMTVFDNVALPLREHSRLSEEDIAGEVNRRLNAVGLADTQDLLPRQLSGGMNRRAGLARAIVTDPEIVLCDEPFSGLDPVNVRRIESLLVDLNRRLNLTMIITSHHLASSLRMADQMVFLTEGRAVFAPPDEFLRSSDPAIVEFLAAERDQPGEGSASASAAASDAPGRSW